MLAEIGSFERDFRTGDALWSDNHYRIFGVDKESFKNTPQICWRSSIPTTMINDGTVIGMRSTVRDVTQLRE